MVSNIFLLIQTVYLFEMALIGKIRVSSYYHFNIRIMKLTVLVISWNKGKFAILLNIPLWKCNMTSAFCFLSTRWCHKRTNGRFRRENTAHETYRLSPEHIEFIGLLYCDKPHVPSSWVCKERGFTQLPQKKKRAGTIR